MSKELMLQKTNAPTYECTTGPELAPNETIHFQKPEDLFQIEEYIYRNGIKKICFDTETSGLDPFTDRLILIQIRAENKIFLLNIPKLGEPSPKNSFYRGILRILGDGAISIIGHNLKFDLKPLSHFFANYSPRFENLFDTYLAEELLNAGRNIKEGSSLKALAKKYLGIEMDKTQRTSFRDGNLTQEQLDYATNDVVVLEPIHRKQSEAIAKQGLFSVAQLEFSIIPAIANIELAGMKIDLQKLSDLKRKYVDHLKNIEAELDGLVCKVPMAGQLSMFGPRINYNSHLQVKQVLSNLGYEVKTTDTEILEKIPHPFAKKLIQHRRASKLISSFIEKLPHHIHPCTGRIHANFFQLGTEAGRFTCETPNLQQVPKDQNWRDLFIAEKGYQIITADYSQIELRILAEYSQDPVLLEAFLKGQDLHSRTAAQMFGVSIHGD
jgi:DNA polymerase-1